MDQDLPTFKEEVISIVRTIPKGRLMTYGQIAALAGSPRAARIVGGIAHFGNSSLPWQRVVSKGGCLAKGYPGGVLGHRQALEKDGIIAKDYRVPVDELLWWPDKNE